MSNATKSDRDRKCGKIYSCSSCIIPCSSCFMRKCEQCRFGYKNIAEKLIEAYSKDRLEEYKDRCVYATFALEILETR